VVEFQGTFASKEIPYNLRAEEVALSGNNRRGGRPWKEELVLPGTPSKV